jgi:hypothetical protein
MALKSILENLKGKEVICYMKNMEQGILKGIIESVNKEIVTLKSDDISIIYVPISNIGAISEKVKK